MARELSVSKKTLYKCFRDKDSLIMTIMDAQLEEMHQTIIEIIDKEDNPILQVAKISDFSINMNRDVNPGMIYDLKKYHFNCYKKFSESLDGFMLGAVEQNLRKGISMGFYRENLNVELVSKLYKYLVMTAFNPVEFPLGNVSIEDAFREIIRYHIHGIVTEKGLKELEKIKWLK